MAGLPDDLTAAARIREAAMRLAAERGFAATSIRSVAASAGVSAGLVQHHFRSKERLRRAVDEFVVKQIADAIPRGTNDHEPARVAEAIGASITDFIRSHPSVFAYIRRSLIEGDATGLRLFDAIVGLARSRLRELDADGVLRLGLDLDWAALHIVLIDAGAMMLEAAVNRHLDAPLRSDPGLDRFGRATTALLTEGIFRSRTDRRRPATTPRRAGQGGKK